MKTLQQRVGNLVKEYAQKIEFAEKEIALLKHERTEIRKETNRDVREMDLEFNATALKVKEAQRLAYIQARTDFDSLLNFPYPAYDPSQLEEAITPPFEVIDWKVFKLVVECIDMALPTEEIIEEVRSSLFPGLDNNDTLKRINRLVGLGLLKHEKTTDKAIGIINQMSIVKYPTISNTLSKAIFPKGHHYKAVVPSGNTILLLDTYKKRVNLGELDNHTSAYYGIMVGPEVLYSETKITELNGVYDKDATHIVIFNKNKIS